MSNAAKHRKKAAEFEHLRQIDRAIASYIKAIEEGEAEGEDIDVALYNKVGDLALRQGRVPDAITYYERAIEHYATSGLFNNAIALCNKVLRSAPGRANVYFTLGRICARKGLRGDATRNFLEYATRMQQEGRIEEGVRALAEVSDLMPELTEVHALVDEYAARAGIALPRRRTPAAPTRVEAATNEPVRETRSQDLVFLQVDYGHAAAARRAPTPVPPVAAQSAVVATAAASGAASLANVVDADADTPHVELPFIVDVTGADNDASTVPTLPSLAVIDALAAQPELPPIELAPLALPPLELPPLELPPLAAIVVPSVPVELPSLADVSVAESVSFDLVSLDALVGDAPSVDAAPMVNDEVSLDAPDADVLEGFEPSGEFTLDGVGLLDGLTPEEDGPLASGDVTFDFAPDAVAAAEGLTSTRWVDDTPASLPAEIAQIASIEPSHVDEAPLDIEPLDIEPLDIEPVAELETAVAEGERTAAMGAHVTPTTTPAFRFDPHDFILPGELPPLMLDDAVVDAGSHVPSGDVDTRAVTPTAAVTIAEPLVAEQSVVTPSAPTPLDIAAVDFAPLSVAPSSAPIVMPTPLEPPRVSMPTPLDIDVVAVPTPMASAPVVAPTPIAVDAVAAPTPIDIAPIAVPTPIEVSAVAAPTPIDIAPIAVPTPINVAPIVVPTPVPTSEPTPEPAPVASVEAPTPVTPIPPAHAVRSTPSLPTAAVAAEASIVATSRRDALTAAVGRLPTNWPLRRRLAEALLEAGDHEAAIAELEIVRQGLTDGGDLAGAAEVADEMVQVGPDRIAFHQRRVELAIRLHDLERLRHAYLDLADALVRMGEEARARAVYVRVLELDPHDIRARTALGAAAPPPPPKAVDGYVDLATWLKDDDEPSSTRMRMHEPTVSGDEQADFESLLRHFKEGVARSLGEDDFESHYDLGVAYKEMGLLDDAIAEFQKALRGQANRLPAYEALGLCFVEQGRHQVAATVLSRALHEPGLGDEQRVGVLYLLASSCQALMRWDEARSYFQRVYATDINFRDVAERLAALDQAAR